MAEEPNAGRAGGAKPAAMEYDLERLFEHPMKFRSVIPPAIVALGGRPTGRRVVRVQWRLSPREPKQQGTLMLKWDTQTLKKHFAEIEDEIHIARHHDLERNRQTECAAIVVAVAVMAHVEPDIRFTQRSWVGTSHDYFLNDRSDEMIEIAGRREGGLPSLFEEKRKQSDNNPSLRKRWVSVTILAGRLRNRTEGLHS